MRFGKQKFLNWEAEKLDLMIIGKRGSGKDTVADFMEGKGYKKYRMAGRVEEACRAFGIDNPTKEDLIMVGTDIGRNMISPNVWVDFAKKDIFLIRKYRRMFDIEPKVIISDIRFHNEYEYFYGDGFFPIKIIVDNEVAAKRASKRDGTYNSSLEVHESEKNTEEFPGYKIHNTGTLDDLYSQLDDLLEKLKDKEFYNIHMKRFKRMYKKGF